MSDKQTDIHKLDNGKLGLINLNNMIPVTDLVIINIDIDNEPRLDYQELMKKQMIEIRKDTDHIRKKAVRLYKIVSSGKQPKLNSRCCDYLTLEDKVDIYNMALAQIESAASNEPKTKQ